MLEITDLLFDHDDAGRRTPVRRDHVAQRLAAMGDRNGARAVMRLPSPGETLDSEYVDRLLVAVHAEIQRLSEEFRHGARVAALVTPLLYAIRAAGIPGPYRVVDLGCGTGYVTRWLSANAAAPDVEYVGLDFNRALVTEAARLARAEHLPCRFELGDAFAMSAPAHVLLSTGVLHHIPTERLALFFENHESGSAHAFAHIDFQPSRIAAFGAWLFHRTRMRLPISRHDGVQSARRAHHPELLRQIAAMHAPSFQTWTDQPRVARSTLPCVLTTLIGVRQPLAAATTTAFGRRARRLDPTL